MLIPATTGEFGVLPGHVPTVAQLKPGVLAVHLDADKNVKKARTTAQCRLRRFTRERIQEGPSLCTQPLFSPSDAANLCSFPPPPSVFRQQRVCIRARGQQH